jgi:plasmid stabilization system protein ParE
VIPVRFLPAAEAELLHEVEYYSRARTGIGVRFQAAVEASIQRATHHPQGGFPSPCETRSVLVKGFPFSMIYRVTEAEMLVVAIAPIAEGQTIGCLACDSRQGASRRVGKGGQAISG